MYRCVGNRLLLSGGYCMRSLIDIPELQYLSMDVCDSNPRGSPVKPQPTLQWLWEPAEVCQEEADALALKFSQHGCTSSRLVGGKGCQLALLTQLNSDVRLYSRFLFDSR